MDGSKIQRSLFFPCRGAAGNGRSLWVEPAQLIALMEPDIKAAEKTRTHTSIPKQSPSPEYLERAKQDQEMFATGSWTKKELAAKLDISRPTLDGYLKVETME